VGDIEHAMRELENERHKAEQEAQTIRNALEQQRMAWQELKVRRQTLQERVTEGGFEIEKLLRELPEQADLKQWENQLENVTQRIQRLGPINLAAIDEFEQQSERKKYLDAQNEDLTESLETLENAIRKIDRETRTRFKETFDLVNKGLQDKFPRLFGGGHAYLELTGDDLLDTGVTVMARPPGKRNSTIHLLSGGEKALTAVALVFSIFELNPSPFCMLDEVDAPLDEANVGRFCKLVKEMSEQVQFIFITHNKATMELSTTLTGVTMHEPGVSRIVAVDVDEAVELAAV
jgi:chromosome segregation protein